MHAEAGDGPGGLGAEVDAQEIKVHGEQPAAHALDGGPVEGVPVEGNEIGEEDLLIGVVDAAGEGGEIVAQGDGGVPQGGAGRVADAHEVGDGHADDGVQGQQNEHGQKGPETAAGGVDAGLLIELGHLLLVLLLIFRVSLLQLRLLAGETAHADHAALGLHLEGQHHQGDQQAEEDDGQTVGPGGGVQPAQQGGKGHAHKLAKGTKHNSYCSSACRFRQSLSCIAAR